MRKALILAGSALALAALLIAALFLFVDPNRFRDQIAAQLQKQLHRPVQLGQMHLSLWPLGIRTENVTISERTGFPLATPFVTAAGIEVRAGLGGLLGGTITVDSIRLDKPRISLVKNQNAQWNYADLTESSAPKDSQPVRLALLAITDGSITLTDLAKPGKPSTWQHLNAELTGIGPGESPTITASMDIAGGTVHLQGSGANPFKAELNASELSLAELSRLAGLSPGLDGKVDTRATVSSANGAFTADSSLAVRVATRNGKPLGKPFSLTFLAESRGDHIEVPRFTLAAGDTSASGKATLNTKTADWNATLAMPDTKLAEALALAQFLGASPMTGEGTISLNLQARGSASGSPELSGTGNLRAANIQVDSLAKPVAIDTAQLRLTYPREAAFSTSSLSIGATKLKGSASVKDYSTPQVQFEIEADKLDIAELQTLAATPPQSATKPTTPSGPGLRANGTIRANSLLAQGLEFTNVSTGVTYGSDRLSMSPFTAKLFGGTHTGSIDLDLRPKIPEMSANLRLADVETNQLLTATTSLKNKLYGALAASGALRMNLAANELPRSLNGRLSANILNGRLAGTDILKELSSIGKFAGYASGAQQVTKITQLAGDLDINNGIATTNNLMLGTEGGTLALIGSINLVDQSLNLQATATLDKSFSQKVGGTSIGGYLSTVLSNNRGELVLPVKIGGTFDKPSFAPDAARMAEMKLKSILPGATPGTGGQRLPSPQSIIDIFKKKK